MQSHREEKERQEERAQMKGETGRALKTGMSGSLRPQGSESAVSVLLWPERGCVWMRNQEDKADLLFICCSRVWHWLRCLSNAAVEFTEVR